jgi:hypothetical protein
VCVWVIGQGRKAERETLRKPASWISVDRRNAYIRYATCAMALSRGTARHGNDGATVLEVRKARAERNGRATVSVHTYVDARGARADGVLGMTREITSMR